MHRRRWTAGALLGAAALAGGAVYVRAQGRPARPGAPAAAPLPVTLIRAERSDERGGGRISGQLLPVRSATISAEVAARVVALPWENGDALPAGALIAQLDDAVARAQLAEAIAGQAQANAARAQAEAEYRRAVVETRAAVAAARAQVARSDAGIAQAGALARQAGEAERKARAATRRQELQQAEAQLRIAQADERLQRQERERFAALLEEEAISRQSFERVQTAWEAAAARREAAEQALSLAREGAREEDIESARAGVAQAAAALLGARARRAEANAALQQAQTRETRLAALRRQIDGLKAQEARAAAIVAQARLVVEKHRLVAPFSGRVLARRTEVGETLAPGRPVIELGAFDRVRAAFAVPERLRGQMHPGQRVVLTVDALAGRRFVGRVATVGFQASRARAFPVEAIIANEGERLQAGMIIRMALPGDSPSARTVVPVSAVTVQGNSACVFVAEGGRAVRRPVVLGAVEGERVVVRTGLRAGEPLIADPQRLSEGLPVTVQEPPR